MIIDVLARRAALTAVLLAGPFSGALAQEAWFGDWDSARKAAEAGKKPILIEFQAVWCYSCYYMEKHVLAGPAFQEAAKSLTLLNVDVDKPEGRDMKEKYHARALPTVVIVDSGGKELGRIVGEQTQKDFLAQLSHAAGKPQEHDKLKSEELSARSALLAAAKEKNAPAAAKAFDDLLGLEDGCSLAYDAEDALEPLSSLAAARRRALLLKAAAKLESLVEKHVFGPNQERCADMRTAAESLCEVYEALGEKGKQANIRGRVVAMLQEDSSKAGVGVDRNLDDNLRFFLEKAGRPAELDELYPRLIAAYPADYVYAYRYAKNLLDRKEYGRALPYAEKGLQLSYGANRLNAAAVKARILAGMGRRDEAVKLLRSEIKAAKARFRKESAVLEQALKEIN